jgi:hypothetical protein
MMANWISSAEAALAGRSEVGGVDTVPRVSPPLFDASTIRALTAPFLAGFMWAAAVFRETQSQQSLDPLALLFRVLALALSVRALRLLILFAGRLRVRLAWRRYALALTPEGLLYRSPQSDVVVPREQVLDVRERDGSWSGKGGRRWADVYVITDPESGRLFLALPPLFERTPGVLVETLMRWLSPSADSGELPPPTAAGAAPQPEPLATKLWDRAAAGEQLPGVVAIRHGSTWLQRGPYASILLGAAMLDGYLRLPESARALLSQGPAVMLGVALVLVPLAWLVVTRASLKARKGLALVLTPGEVLVRTRAGLQRIRWADVTRCDVLSRTTWSLLQGTHQARAVVLQRKGESSIQCAEAFLSIPAEVVAGLCDAYRKGVLGRAVRSET